jgi:hypothetical protein
MHYTISKEVKAEVKKLLPRLREDVKKEFIHWDRYKLTDAFHSDDEVFEILPYSAYEYILLSWGLEPSHITITSVVQAMNNKLFGDLKHITCHALRRLALCHNPNKKDDKSPPSG